jgi:hypothetical protein
MIADRKAAHHIETLDEESPFIARRQVGREKRSLNCGIGASSSVSEISRAYGGREYRVDLLTQALAAE